MVEKNADRDGVEAYTILGAWVEGGSSPRQWERATHSENKNIQQYIHSTQSWTKNKSTKGNAIYSTQPYRLNCHKAQVTISEN